MTTKAMVIMKLVTITAIIIMTIINSNKDGVHNKYIIYNNYKKSR